MKRYEKQIALSEVAAAGQQKLSEAKVLVVGAGGLGCPVLQQLVAAGVGCIGIVDGDRVQESNLNRQTLYTLSDCGELKVSASTQALSRQNSEVKLHGYPHHFTQENAFEIAEGYQIIVDCTDSLQARYLINDVTLVLKIPMVYASVHQFQGQLSVFNYELGPTYRCLFPEAKNRVEVNCDDSGVLGVLPSVLGVLQATEVLKILLGIGSVSSGKLLLYDGLSAQVHQIEIPKNPLQVQTGLLRGIEIHNRTSVKVKGIQKEAFLEALNDESQLVIDLKESYQDAVFEHPNIQNIPLHELENYLQKYPNDQKIVLFCRFGNQSFHAAKYLHKKGYSAVSHLENGSSSLAL